jgi:hypothetical protein
MKAYLLKSEMRRVSSLPTLIQYSAWFLSKSIKVRERNTRDMNKKGRSQVIPFCRWYDPILKRH